MSEVFKFIGIAVAVILADALFCVFLALITVDNGDKWIPAFVFNVAGFVACMTILIAKVV